MIRKTATLLAVCIAAPLGAQAFEGTVTMNVVGDNGAAHPISYMLKSGKMRFDPGGAQVSVIIDPATQRMMVIMNAQKMYMEREFGSVSAAVQQQKAAGSSPSIVHTKKMDVVAGYKCEHITVTDDDGQSVDSCISNELGGFRMPMASNPMAPQREAAWISQLGSANFPLKVVKNGRKDVMPR